VLLTIGDLREEILVRLEESPRRGEDVAVRSRRIRAGSAANVAALDAQTGGSPRFVGQVGDDDIGRALTAELEAMGVECRVRFGGRTGATVSLLDDRSRSRLIDRGASRRLSVIDAGVLDDITQVYVAASAFLEDPLAGAVESLVAETEARRVEVTVGMPGRLELAAFGADAFLALIEAIRPHTVVGNADEHAALGLQRARPVPGASVTVVTDGAQSTSVCRTDDERLVTVDPVRVRDATGAGDGFIAGYLSARRLGADPVAAVHGGHRVARRVLAHIGPTIG